MPDENRRQSFFLFRFAARKRKKSSLLIPLPLCSLCLCGLFSLFFSSLVLRKNMHIVHVASELAGVAKVGGLGDVVYGLARETAKCERVEIFLPRYDCLDESVLKDLKVELRGLPVKERGEVHSVTLWSARCDGVKLFLVEAHHPKKYFDRGVVYGCPDDIDRFLFFTKACLEALLKMGLQPDAVHIHDWPTAALAPLYKDLYAEQGLSLGGVVLTLHNLQHQGKCAPFNLSAVGLKGESYLNPEKMQDPLHPELVNLLKGGIVYSDFLTTVSPSYEQEIKTPDGGHHLHALLIRHQNKLKGILNGIDAEFWDPATDRFLTKTYSTKKMVSLRAGKRENRKQLQAQLGLKESKGPLVGCVTRLVPQKGPELIAHGIKRTLELGGQFILLGTSPIPAVQEEFLKLKKELEPSRNIAIVLDRNEALAHQIFAAIDSCLIPSIFEPCGLTQMIALRYGAIPIVRKTGGLADTVFDGKNGFTFDFPDLQGVDWALGQFFKSWVEEPKKIEQLIKNGVAADNSWTHSALEYVNLYKTFRMKERLA
jgi:starch synthase